MGVPRASERAGTPVRASAVATTTRAMKRLDRIMKSSLVDEHPTDHEPRLGPCDPPRRVHVPPVQTIAVGPMCRWGDDLRDGHDSPTVDDPALKVDPDAHSVTVGADVGGGIVCRRDIAARWPDAG